MKIINPLFFLSIILTSSMLFISELNAFEENTQQLSPVTQTNTTETSQAYAHTANDPYLDELAKDTWAYLSSDWATSNHLPWSWRSETITWGGKHGVPMQIQQKLASMASHPHHPLLVMGNRLRYAGNMESQLGGNGDQFYGQVTAVLDQLRAWQTGSQAEQPNGANAYNNSVFSLPTGSLHHPYHTMPTIFRDLSQPPRFVGFQPSSVLFGNISIKKIIRQSCSLHRRR